MGDVDMVSPNQEAVDRRLPTLSKEETARLGKKMYQREIRRRVDANHVGEVVAIDVDTGIWAIGHDVLEAVDGLRGQSPEAVNVWSERVGYRAMASFGGRSLQRAE